MKKVSLHFKDILLLLEYLEHTKTHYCHVNYEKAIITCELSDADIELAINGYDASVKEDSHA